MAYANSAALIRLLEQSDQGLHYLPFHYVFKDTTD